MPKQLKTLLKIISLLSVSASAEISLLKPLVGKHFRERNHPQGLSYNEVYLDSIGLGYRGIKDIGASLLYVANNSLRNPSFFLHMEFFMPLHQGYFLHKLGIGIGAANGYPKKIQGISKTDFRPSGGLQYEMCRKVSCIMFQGGPTYSSERLNGVIVLGYKMILRR